MQFFKEFTKGLWKEIPPFRLVLGLCPTLAVTKSAFNGFGMGAATLFVLVCSNVLISLLRNVIPSKVRIASYILVIAAFVTIVNLLMQAYTFALWQSLGMFIPLIVVNCIVLGRAEAFAGKNTPGLSFADGLGIGLGYTLALSFLGGVRELIGAGTFLSGTPMERVVFGEHFMPFSIVVQAPGAFMCLGIILGLMSLIGKK